MSDGAQTKRRKKPVQKRGQTGSPVLKSKPQTPYLPEVTADEIALGLTVSDMLGIIPPDLKKAMRQNPTGTVNTIKLALHHKQLTRHQAKDAALWKKQAKHMVVHAATERQANKIQAAMNSDDNAKKESQWRDNIPPPSLKMPTISFFTLTTFESAKRGVSMDEATRRGTLTRNVTMPVVAATAAAPYVIAAAAEGGAAFLAWDAAKVAAPLTAKSMGVSAGIGAGLGTTLYLAKNGKESTPAGLTTAATAGALSGATKNALNASAMVPNTIIPFTLTNATTQLNTQMISKGMIGWIGYTNMPKSGNSWFTRPIKDTWAQWANDDSAQ